MQTLLDENEVSKLTLVSKRTLQDWRSRRTGPALPFVKLGRSIRYRVEDVEALIENSVRAAGGDV